MKCLSDVLEFVAERAGTYLIPAPPRTGISQRHSQATLYIAGKCLLHLPLETVSTFHM